MSRTIYGTRAELARDRERDPLPGERIENHRMAVAHPANLDPKRCAPFAQSQALDAILEQTSVSQFQVKLPQRDLGEIRDQPCDLSMFLFREEFGLMLQLRRRELVELFDEMRE